MRLFTLLLALTLLSCQEQRPKETTLEYEVENLHNENEKLLEKAKAEADYYSEQIEERKKELDNLDEALEEKDNEVAEAYFAPVIKYIHYSNGGVTAFYDNGYVCYCPRCDLNKENVKALMTTIPADGYNASYVEYDDYLELSNDEKMYFSDYGWAMVRYKWMEQIN